MAAKEFRHFTTEEMAKMAKTTTAAMERWLSGALPRSLNFEKVIRLVE